MEYKYKGHSVKVNEVNVPPEPPPAPAHGNPLILFPNYIMFRNVGRAKATFFSYCRHEPDFWAAVKRHLLSSDLEFEFDAEKNTGWILGQGIRCFGRFEVMEHVPGEPVPCQK